MRDYKDADEYLRWLHQTQSRHYTDRTRKQTFLLDGSPDDVVARKEVAEDAAGRQPEHLEDGQLPFSGAAVARRYRLHPRPVLPHQVDDVGDLVADPRSFLGLKGSAHFLLIFSRHSSEAAAVNDQELWVQLSPSLSVPYSSNIRRISL